MTKRLYITIILGLTIYGFSFWGYDIQTKNPTNHTILSKTKNLNTEDYNKNIQYNLTTGEPKLYIYPDSCHIYAQYSIDISHGKCALSGQYIYTASHVVSGYIDLDIYIYGQLYTGSYSILDMGHDLAQIYVDSDAYIPKSSESPKIKLDKKAITYSDSGIGVYDQYDKLLGIVSSKNFATDEVVIRRIP